MHTEYIDQFLEKFYRGDTTREEEKILSDYFAQADVPEKYAQDKKVFASLSDYEIGQSDTFEQRVETFVDSLQAPEVENYQPKRRTMWTKALSIAASLLIVLSIGFLANRYAENNRNTLADTYENPDEAYQATMDALAMFSEKYSEGMEPMKKADSHLQKTQEIINQTIK